MKQINLISLAVLCALYAQISVGCSSCDAIKRETKACSCTQPKPTEETKACSCQRPTTKNDTLELEEEAPCACSCGCTDEQAPTTVTAEVQVGELIDKITILTIKSENITDPEKLKNIHAELNTLTETLDEHVPNTPELQALTDELLMINKQLWCIEDDIRDKEREKAFDNEFIQLARSVYYTNDERCAVKRKINELTGSRLMEEKSYSDYQ